jgi:hypothetical protein
MGWLKHILLGDFGQSLDIEDTRAAVDGQAAAQRMQGRRLANADAEIARLHRRTEALHLALTALTRHLIDQRILDEAELAAMLERIDASDGTIDGRLAFAQETGGPRLVTGPPAPGPKPKFT